MSVCEMQRQLARADLQKRHAEFEIALAEYERGGLRGERPSTPVPDGGTGLGRAYCRVLTLFSPNVANAQDARTRGRGSSPAIGRSRDSSRFATPQQAQSIPIPDPIGLQSRIQEARFRADEAQRERDRFDVEIQKKFSLAAACVVFVLVGAPIALRFPRGGVGLVIGVSFAIFGLYYVGLIGGETLADKGYLPPWVAMWIANILLLILGLILASQMGRESSTARGGDFAELLATAKARIFGWLRAFGIPVERRRK